MLNRLMTSTLLLTFACGDSVYKPDADTGANSDTPNEDADAGGSAVDADSPDTDGGDDGSDDGSTGGGDDTASDADGASPTDTGDTGSSPSDTGEPAAGDTGAAPIDTGTEAGGDTGASPTNTGETEDEDTGGETAGGDDDPEPTGDPVDYCHIQWPCGMTTVAGGDMEPVYIWVYEGGVTDYAGAGGGIEVQLGVGETGSLPDESWTWTEASYNDDKDGLTPGDLANDEYFCVGTAPTETSTYDYAGRVRLDEGPWLYCDWGGDCGGSGSDDGYSPFMAGQLTVTSSPDEPL